MKQRLNEQLTDMTETIKQQFEVSREQEKLRDQKQNRKKKLEEHNEECKSRINAALKATAITKFETVFSAMFARNLRKAAVDTLSQIKKPLFPKNEEQKPFEIDLEQ